MKKKVFKKPFNSVKKLSKEELFEREIDKAYKRIYGVKKENWNNAVNKVIKLTEIAEKENWRVKELGIKESVNSFFSSQKQRLYN